VKSFLQHILYRHVDMFYFITGRGCHYSPLHFKIRTQITLAQIQVLQQHFQCHSQYYNRLTVSVCKHTAAFPTVTSVLLLLGVLSVAISTVFQAYLTTFLIEPGFEEPIRTIEEMLKSPKKIRLLLTVRITLYQYFRSC